MSFAAVCFDLDGVIIDSESAHKAAFVETLKAISNYELSNREYTEYFAGKTDRQGFADFTKSNAAMTYPITKLMAAKNAFYVSSATKHIKIQSQVAQLVKTLHLNGTRLALVTGSSAAEANLAITACGLNNHFEVVISADDIKNSKPHPEPYLLAATKLGLDPSSCIAIEDSPSGVSSAQAAGMLCVAVFSTHDTDSLRTADKQASLSNINRTVLKLLN